MDVEKSRVVVCSANYAWYYDVASNCDRPCQESEAKGDKGDGGYPRASNMPIKGFRLPSDCVIEARFSGDTARCFFGTMTGHIYVVSERITFYVSDAIRDRWFIELFRLHFPTTTSSSLPILGSLESVTLWQQIVVEDFLATGGVMD